MFNRLAASVLVLAVIISGFATVLRPAESNANESVRYEFEQQEVQLDKSVVFTPVNVTDGWLADLADGGDFEVTLGAFAGDRLIRIAGSGGEVEYLLNSFSAMEGYSVHQFWSAKQRDGDAVVKDKSGDIQAVLLYEFIDGSMRLFGYTIHDGESDAFINGEPPSANYFYSKN